MSLTLNTLVYPFVGFMNQGIARYQNAGVGAASGFKTATAKVDIPGKDGNFKVRWKLRLPTVVTDDSCACPTGFLRENFADIVVTVNAGAPAAERTALALSLKDLVATPEFQASITSLLTPSA